MTDFQWYPGHMTRARRMMEENVRLVDLVIELTDARAPLSGRNPDIDELAAGKGRLLILNKVDLADEAATTAFCRFFEEKGITSLPLNARDRKAADKIRKAVLAATRQKREKDRQRGILNRPIRAMVAGIPNVGKSTLINSLSGRASARTGNLPGVTRGKQWITFQLEPEKKAARRNNSYRPGNPMGVAQGQTLSLLDTPGILWPKFDDPLVGIRLALIGSIRDEVVDEEELAQWLLTYAAASYPAFLTERYGTPAVTLEDVAIRRHYLGAGGAPDTKRTAHAVLEDFRSGRLGRITLEAPTET